MKRIAPGILILLGIVVPWWLVAGGRGALDLIAGAAARQGGPTPVVPSMGGMPMLGEKPDPSIPLATTARGSQPATFREESEIKTYDLTAGRVRWNILPDQLVVAWAYNGQVPGPLIRVTEGDRLRINFRNDLPEPTTVHWHGLPVPYQMDGVPEISQPAVPPGGAFTYEFEAKPAGTFFYHSHVNEAKQIGLGLSGAIVIDPSEGPRPDKDIVMVLQEWTVDTNTGETFGAAHSGSEGNFFTINGKAYPATDPITVAKGERVRIRLINPGQVAHPMHLHGHSFKIVATDGHPVPAVAQLTKDTVNVATAERYDIEFVADNPGVWFFHCHIAHHTTNDGQEPGGLIALVQYEGFAPIGSPRRAGAPSAPAATPTQPPESMPGMGH